jgi:hypothetical protein
MLLKISYAYGGVTLVRKTYSGAYEHKLACAHGRNKGSTHARVFLVQVNAVDIVGVHESNKVVLEFVAIRRLHCLTQDRKSSRLSAKSPATKRNNLLDASHGLEELKLLADGWIRDFNSVIASGNVRECEMDVCVLSRVDLVDVHRQALAIEVP